MNTFKKINKNELLWFQASIAFCHLVLRSHKLICIIIVNTDGCCFHFQAFAEKVVERPAQPSFTFHPHNLAPSVLAAAAAEHEAGASGRPISKFRASRQKSNSATSSSTLNPAGAAFQGQDGGSATSTRPVSKFRSSQQKQDGVRWSLEGLQKILWRTYCVMPSSGFSLQRQQIKPSMSPQYTPVYFVLQGQLCWHYNASTHKKILLKTWLFFAMHTFCHSFWSTPDIKRQFTNVLGVKHQTTYLPMCSHKVLYSCGSQTFTW